MTSGWELDTEWKDYPDGIILDISRVRQRARPGGGGTEEYVEELEVASSICTQPKMVLSCLNDHCTCVALVGNCSLSILWNIKMEDANACSGTLLLWS